MKMHKITLVMFLLCLVGIGQALAVCIYGVYADSPDEARWTNFYLWFTLLIIAFLIDVALNFELKRKKNK